ncbi:MAG: SPFH domain-containing protein [Candidatus Brocadiaceae bacterium]|jgi:membrane protease subunit HflC
MKESKLTVAVVAGVCVVLLLKLVVFTVPVDHMAVLYRLNKVRKVIKPNVSLVGDTATGQLHAQGPGDGAKLVREAGLYFKLPYPIETVKYCDQRIRVLDGPLTQQQLPDGNQVLPRVYATWRIVDPVAFEKNLQSDEETAEKRLKTIISNQAGIVFGRHRLKDVVNTDPEELQFDEIERRILDGVTRALSVADNSYGIEVCSLGITWITLPEETTKAVFVRMQKERQRIAESLRAEGERIKRTKIAEAREKSDRITAEAEAEAKGIRAQGEAEAAQYYDTFARDQALAVFLRRLEAIRRIASAATAAGRPVTFVLSTRTEPFSMLERGIEETLEEQTGPDLGELLRATEELSSAAKE